MQDNPLVSIIVPVYKVEPYLRRCLNSIVNQTYTNLEIILVDDGSPDNCPAICDEYAAKDSRIIVIHKENGGLSDARNAGLNICLGDYVYFVDSDDVIFENTIDSLVAPLDDSYYDIVIGDYSASNDTSSKRHVVCPHEKLKTNLEIMENFCLGKFPICAWNKLCSRKFLIENHLFFKKGLLFEDQLWCCELATKLHSVRFISKKTYWYRIRFDSIMNSSKINFEQRMDSWLYIIQACRALLNKDVYKENCETDYFFLLKLTEISKALVLHQAPFHHYMKELSIIFGKNVIYFWWKYSHNIKKFFFAVLSHLPSFVCHHILYLNFKYIDKPT